MLPKGATTTVSRLGAQSVLEHLGGRSPCPGPRALLRLRGEQLAEATTGDSALWGFEAVSFGWSGLAPTVGTGACLGFGLLGGSSFPPCHLLECVKRQNLSPFICSQTFKEIFVRSLADHRDNGRETSVTQNTHFAKAVWKSHKHTVPALNRQQSVTLKE